MNVDVNRKWSIENVDENRECLFSCFLSKRYERTWNTNQELTASSQKNSNIEIDSIYFVGYYWRQCLVHQPNGILLCYHSLFLFVSQHLRLTMVSIYFVLFYLFIKLGPMRICAAFPVNIHICTEIRMDRSSKRSNICYFMLTFLIRIHLV